jgi:hypothetical protein
MRSQRSILSLKYTPTTAKGGVRRAVGGLLRYVQYRDHHEDRERARDVGGLLRYVAWRDAATPQGRLFTEHGQAGDAERLALGNYVARSVAGLQRSPDSSRQPHRAVYRMVLSPEDARGLELRLVTREAMAQLERDSGAKLPPWIAAEHRNTAHPHTHVVLAARREVEPGRFRAVVITKRRLERMKAAMAHEIARQRGERVAGREQVLRDLDRQRSRTHLRLHRASQIFELGRFAGRVARHYLAQANRLAARRQQDRELEAVR